MMSPLHSGKPQAASAWLTRRAKGSSRSRTASNRRRPDRERRSHCPGRWRTSARAGPRSPARASRTRPVRCPPIALRSRSTRVVSRSLSVDTIRVSCSAGTPCASSLRESRRTSPLTRAQALDGVGRANAGAQRGEADALQREQVALRQDAHRTIAVDDDDVMEAVASHDQRRVERHRIGGNRDRIGRHDAVDGLVDGVPGKRHPVAQVAQREDAGGATGLGRHQHGTDALALHQRQRRPQRRAQRAGHRRAFQQFAHRAGRRAGAPFRSRGPRARGCATARAGCRGAAWRTPGTVRCARAARADRPPAAGSRTCRRPRDSGSVTGRCAISAPSGKHSPGATRNRGARRIALARIESEHPALSNDEQVRRRGVARIENRRVGREVDDAQSRHQPLEARGLHAIERRVTAQLLDRRGGERGCDGESGLLGGRHGGGSRNATRNDTQRPDAP